LHKLFFYCYTTKVEGWWVNSHR